MRLFKNVFNLGRASLTSSLLAALLTVSMGWPSLGYAQVGALRVGTQSPTAAALGKFGDMPVGLYTGTPSIEVPLHEVEGRKLSFPVTLKYHASGVKVGAVPSWVGMGWALEAGGIITRTIRSLPDDHPSGYMRTGRDIGQTIWSASSPSAVSSYLIDGNVETELTAYMQDIEQKRTDPEPDQFFFNFAGRSGQFVIDSQGEAVLTPHANLDVAYDLDPSGQIRSWTVTAEDGTQYVFKEKEYVTRSTGDWATGWHLTEVRSASGEDTITLSYSDRRTTEFEQRGYAAEQVLVGNTKSGPASSVPVVKRIESVQLSSIQTARETIRFYASQRGSDFMEGDHRKLDRVDIETPEGMVKRSFEFTYVPKSAFGKRLTLSTVQEKPPAGAPPEAAKPPYQMSYDESASLPGLTSSQVDHWGYYNGRSNGSKIIPEARYEYNDEYAYYEGADRRPSAAHMEAGMLERIDYPAGGHTEFEFEPHDYSYIGRFPAPPETNLQSKTASADAIGRDYDETSIQVVNEADDDPVQATLSGDYFLEEKSNDVCPGSRCVWAALTLASSGETVAEWVPPQSPTSVSLDPGAAYVLEAHSNSTMEGTGIAATLEWKNKVIADTDKQIAGGLRVRAVRHYDGQGGAPTVKSYRYPAVGDASLSSGVLVRRPHYFWVERFGGTRAINLSSSPLAGLGLTQGSPVGYERVVVLNGPDSTQGWVDHRFWTARDPEQGDDVGELDYEEVWPGSRRTSYDFKRGWEREVQTYNGDGTLRRKVKRQRYTSDAVGDPPTRRIQALSYKPNSDGAPQYFKRFEVIASWLHPTSEQVTIYDEDGSSTTTTKEYAYETGEAEPAFTQLRSVTETTPSSSGGGGLERTRRYEYAHELSSNSGMRSGAGGTHQLSQKYSTTVLDGSGAAVLSKQWTTWKPNTESAGTDFVPEMEYVWTGAGNADATAPADPEDAPEEALRQKTYLSYNAHGQPTETRSARGQAVSYAYQGRGGRLSRSSTTVGGQTLAVEYRYNTRGFLSEVIGENGETTSYAYDAFGRLAQVFNDAGEPVRRLVYAYGDPASGNPSYVRTTLYGGGGAAGSPNQVQATYFDGLGRELQRQTVLGGGAEAAVWHTSYDAFGRPYRQWRPVRVPPIGE